VPNTALRQRLVTTAWLVPLIVGAVLLLPTSVFALVMAGIVLLAAWEWGPLVGLDGPVPRALIVAAVALAMLLLWFYQPSAEVVLVPSLIWWLGFTAALPFLTPTSASRGLDVALLPLALLLLAVPWFAVVYLHGDGAAGPSVVLGLMVMIWVGDSAAYFAGSRFGRRKLAPRLSPGKTWVGLYAALGAASLCLLTTGVILDMNAVTTLWLMLLGATTVALSVVGDLCESWLKRRRGLKDSGALLPGHGGVLDRIDSMTAAAPVFALGLIWLGLTA
jgi:phosphatidate cytidylyltransferase